jgi:glycosyltransferase involved in cell wall biosynthesis
MTKLPLSLVIITLNEEKNIERCIKSVPFVSEIVIFDSESLDRTCSIAQKTGEEMGVQVVIHQQPWLGYGLQKRQATGAARYDWVLNLDADEALTPELAAEIQEKFHDLNPEVGYLLPRKSFHLGRWILHGGWYPDRQLRLYHRQFANWSEDKIHERVVPLESTAKSWSTLSLRTPMLHFVFRDLRHQIETNNKYSSLQAEAYLRSGKRFSYFKFLVKPVSKFIECYFLKLGFLDGLPGFVIAVGAGYSVFLRWCKIWEQERIKS